MAAKRRNAAHENLLERGGVDYRAIQLEAVTPQELDAIRHKISAAAYQYGGEDLGGLFNKIDKDNNGGIDEEELIGMVRRVLRIASHTISDGQVAAVFRAIDIDGGGVIQLDELVAFVKEIEYKIDEDEVEIKGGANGDDEFLQYASVSPSSRPIEATTSAENLLHLRSGSAPVSGGWALLKSALQQEADQDGQSDIEAPPEPSDSRKLSVATIVNKFGQFGVPSGQRKQKRFEHLDASEVHAAAVKLHTGWRRKVAMDKLQLHNNGEKIVRGASGSSPTGSPLRRKKANKSAKLQALAKFQRIVRSATQTVGIRWEAIFRHYDAERSGNISYVDLYRIIRRELRIPKKMVPDSEIALIIQILDSEAREAVDVRTWLGFVSDDDVPGNTGARFSDTDDAHTRNNADKDSPGHAQHYMPYDAPHRPRMPLHRGSLRASPAKVLQAEQDAKQRAMIERARERLRNAVYRLKSSERGGGWAAVVTAWDPKQQDYPTFIESVRKFFRISKISLADESLDLVARHLDAAKRGVVDFKDFLAFVSQDSEIHREAVISSVTPEELDTVRSKIGAAAYTFGGQNVSDLFNKIDKDHSGGLDEEEFISMVRRNLRLPSHTISDGQVAAVFRAIDVDGSGTIELDELIAFTTKSEIDVSPKQTNGGPEASSAQTPAKSKEPQGESRSGEKSANRGSWKKKAPAKKAATPVPTPVPSEIDNVLNKLLAATYMAGFSDLGALLLQEFGVARGGNGQVKMAAFIDFVRTKLRLPSTVLDDAALSKLKEYLGGSNTSIETDRLVKFVRSAGQAPHATEATTPDPSKARAKVGKGGGQRRRIRAEDLFNEGGASESASSATAPTTHVEGALDAASEGERNSSDRWATKVANQPRESSTSSTGDGEKGGPSGESAAADAPDWKDVLSKQLVVLEESDASTTDDASGALLSVEVSIPLVP
jgi:Ca2+-binding EF-hand superfamily protein